MHKTYNERKARMMRAFLLVLRSDDFLGNNVEWVSKKIHLFFILLSVILLFQFPLSRVSSWDEVDFSLGVVQFDLLQMQPHFPGYPYFILGGMIVHTFIENPTLSLVIFNCILYTSSIIPIYFLAKRIVCKQAIFLTSVVFSISYVSVITVQPMSEGAAISVLWWFIWSIVAAFNHHQKWFQWIPSFLFSVLLGIRLSYIPFGVGLLWFWYEKWRKEKNAFSMIKQIVVAIFFQCIWVSGLIFSEGSIHSFFALAFSFVNGHFSDWGGAATAEGSASLSERIITLFFYNILWTGISSHSILLLVLYIGVFILAIYSILKHRLNKMDLFYGSLLFSYFLWALFAQNIEKPRHSLPLIALVVFWMLAKWISHSSKKLVVTVTTILVMGQFVTSFALLKQQYTEVPAVHQLMHYLKEEEKAFVLYTWEETRVMEYYDAPFEHKRILTYSLFSQDVSYYPNRTIYVTNHVLEGFEKQGIDVKNRVSKVKEFTSNEIFDPVYSKITLYRWE